MIHVRKVAYILICNYDRVALCPACRNIKEPWFQRTD